MPNVIPYNNSTRDQFGRKTQVVLDLIQDQFPKVEIEPPSNETGQWFVQVYRNDADTPEGFFGDSSLESALRLAKALKLTTS